MRLWPLSRNLTKKANNGVKNWRWGDRSRARKSGLLICCLLRCALTTTQLTSTHKRVYSLQALCGVIYVSACLHTRTHSTHTHGTGRHSTLYSQHPRTQAGAARAQNLHEANHFDYCNLHYLCENDSAHGVIC